jgi:hypothetical protein
MAFALSDIKLRSPAFDYHGRIPPRHSGEGADVSPPLTWENAPAGTRSFAVICHDPDAPLLKNGRYGFVHWVLYGIPPTADRLEEDTDAGTTGMTDFGRAGYGGPMPPEGHGTHHYYFWILALDADPDLEPGLELAAFLERVEPHVIGMNRLVGTYKRA